jgi:uridine kinase
MHLQLALVLAVAHAGFNFDHPDAFDVAEIMRCLDTLRKGKEARVPVYDFVKHDRSVESRLVKPVEVILFEGILILHVPEVVERLNMKVSSTHHSNHDIA